MDRKSLSYKVSLFGCAFAAIVVLLGAYTRLVDAGLGCPDWPGCYGFLSVPDTEDEIKIAEQAYPHAPVEADKAWPEMVHRYFAGTLGLIIALLAVLAIKARKDDTQPLTLPLLLALVIFQAALGMWTLLIIVIKLFNSGYQRFAGWLLLVLAAQITLGISNVVFSLPLAVAVAHNGIAALLLLTMVTLVHNLGQQQASP